MEGVGRKRRWRTLRAPQTSILQDVKELGDSRESMRMTRGGCGGIRLAACRYDPQKAGRGKGCGRNIGPVMEMLTTRTPNKSVNERGSRANIGTENILPAARE